MLKIKTFLMQNRLIVILFSLIFVLGSFLRIFRFNDIPYLIPPAASYYAFDAYSLVTTPRFQVFFPENTGREGLFMYILAIFYFVFGYHFYVRKLVVLFINLITFVSIPILVYRLTRNKWVSLVSFLYFALMNWVIIQNRLPFRFNQTIFFEIVLILSFTIFVFRPRIVTAIFSGLLAGLGFYTYLSYRSNLVLLSLLFTFLLFYNIFVKKEKLIRIIFLCVIYLLSLLCVVTPLVTYFYTHKEDFFNRVTDTSVFVHHSHPYGVIKKNIFTYLYNYLVYGFKTNLADQLLVNYSFLIISASAVCSFIKKRWKDFYLSLIVVGGYASFGVIALSLYNYYDWQGYYQDHVFYGLALYKTIAVSYCLYYLINFKNRVSNFLLVLFLFLFLFSSILELKRNYIFFIDYKEPDVVAEHKYADSILDLAKTNDFVFYFENEEFDRFNLRVQPTIENNRITRHQENNIYYVLSSEQLKTISKLPCKEKKCAVVFALNGGVHVGNHMYIDELLSKFGGKVGPNRDFGYNFFYFTWTNE